MVNGITPQEYPKQLILFSVCSITKTTKRKGGATNEHHQNTEHHQGESDLL